MSFELYLSMPERIDYANLLCERFGLVLLRKRPSSEYFLELGMEKLSLENQSQKHGGVVAEFVEGAAKHRREFGGGRGQPIAKAIGLKGAKTLPHVMDATAGLGRDSMVLASLGCQVTMIERSPVAAALLFDALERAKKDPSTQTLANRMHLVHANACTYLTELAEMDKPDVVLVDPMFPDADKKKAAVKKEMQAFQEVIGFDQDSAQLLTAALHATKTRVVVKRPRLGPTIEGIQPTNVLDGKSTRFDLYVIKALAIE